MEIRRPFLVVQKPTMRCEAKADGAVDTSQRNIKEFPEVTSTASEDDALDAVDNAGLARTA